MSKAKASLACRVLTALVMMLGLDWQGAARNVCTRTKQSKREQRLREKNSQQLVISW